MTSLQKIYKLQAKLLSEIEKEREFIEKSVGALQKESRKALKALVKRKRRSPRRSKQRQSRKSPKHIKSTK